MTPLFLRERSAATWKLVAAQFGVIAKAQLLELGYTLEAIRHRVRIGRLHVVHRCVYAVGRPELTIQGRWMAAVLASRDGARLSGQSMAGHPRCERRGLNDPDRPQALPWRAGKGHQSG